MVQIAWNELLQHYSDTQLGEFVVMPNHVQGIIIITSEGNVGAGLKPAPTKPAPLPEIVRALKTFSARKINEFQ